MEISYFTFEKFEAFGIFGPIAKVGPVAKVSNFEHLPSNRCIFWNVGIWESLICVQTFAMVLYFGIR